MLTGELRNKVDRIWDAFWSGGIANPLTVIEQITYLLFIRRMDELHTAREKKAAATGERIEDPLFNSKQQKLRWSRFKDLEPEAMYRLVSQEVFPHMKELGSSDEGAFSKYMKGATFMIPTPRLLANVVDMLNAIPMNDRDTKGDLYEYLLSKIATAGQNGQFRTPRHIIRMMVELAAPTPDDTICDPSAGSAGFLVAAGEYLREKHADQFHDRKWLNNHYNKKMFNGFEFDATMIRIGSMNLQLHGIEHPNLYDIDALSEDNKVSDQYSLILANPPFKGALDEDTVEKSLLKAVKTKKTELLFLALMLRMLRTSGRCAVIVPDGVLFGSSTAHRAIREKIVKEQKLHAVISMPSGVFKPYAGVSTAVLIFTKTNSGGTDKVWFYDMKADGRSLDDKRTLLGKSDPKDPDDEYKRTYKHEENNIADIIQRWRSLKAEDKRKRTEQSFMVPVKEIIGNNYDLSINRYKEIVHEEKVYAKPYDIINDKETGIRALDRQRAELLKELEELLG